LNWGLGENKKKRLPGKSGFELGQKIKYIFFKKRLLPGNSIFELGEKRCCRVN
jgi:hypothetical protein